MRTQDFRLSRIAYPRASLWAMALLVIVFLVFGAWAQAYVPAADDLSMFSSNPHEFHHWTTDWVMALLP